MNIDASFQRHVSVPQVDKIRQTVDLHVRGGRTFCAREILRNVIRKLVAKRK